METSAPSSSSTSNRATFACTRCAGRKVKCDRQRPCSACVKHNVDCRFNPVQPPRKRYKRVNIQVLTDRLKHCEALLQEQGVDPSKLPDTPSSEQFDQHHKPSQAAPVVPNTPSSIDSPPNRSINKTQVVHEKGRSQFVDNSLWTRMVEEVSCPGCFLVDSRCARPAGKHALWLQVDSVLIMAFRVSGLISFSASVQNRFLLS